MGGVRCARVSAAWLGRGGVGSPVLPDDPDKPGSFSSLRPRTLLRTAWVLPGGGGGGPLPRTHARTAFHACRPPYFASSGFLESREGPPFLGGACARGCGKVGEVAEVGVFTCWDAPGPPMTETNSCLQGARSLVGSCSALCP